MRALSLAAAFFALTTATRGQSAVDTLAEELDFMSKGSVDNWKYSTNFKEDPTQQDFDDSSWEVLKLGQSIYPDSCWLRKEVVLPERVLGEKIAGRVRFLVSVDDYGYLWVNGESKGFFPWDGEFLLTENAQPGEHFLIVIRAVNTGGPLRLLRAQIQTGSSSDLRSLIDDFVLSIRTGQKLLSFDTYQTNARVKVDPGIDRSTIDRDEKKRLNDLLQSVAGELNVQALKNGDVRAFRMSLASARNKLNPVGTFARRFTLFFNSNAHIDAAWLWRDKETVEVCENTLSSVINMMASRPDFTYTQSSAAFYDWIEHRDPSLFSQIQAQVKKGRWEVTGGMWVEPDCNLPDGESWARHLLYSKRYFRSRLGSDVKIGWNPDSFGYNRNMPMFYRNAGIDAFITQKIGWNDTDVFPYRLFWWESADGSRILSYFPFDYVNTIDDPFRLVDWLRQFEANTGFTSMLVLFGVGDHGGGPSLEMLDRIDRLKSLDIFPRIEEGTTATYLAHLREHDLSSIPVWKDELYLEYHRGTYTTQARMKQRNRESETLLTNAEKFSAIASLSGRPCNPADLESAWRLVLFNQFHDILPGSGIRENYIDANEKYDLAEEIGMFELGGSLRSIAGRINTSAISEGTPLVVFNPLAQSRTDIVSVKLEKGDTLAYSVLNMSGAEIPSQTISHGKYDREVIFRATDVPSLGYSTYVMREGGSKTDGRQLSGSVSGISNEYYSVAVDSATGWLRSIIDKRSGREILSGEGNELQLLEDKPTAWDAWNIGLTGVRYPSTFRGAEVVERGPVRTVLRLTRDYLKPGTKKDFPTEDFPTSFFTQDVILYAGIDRVEFVTEVDWWEEKTMLKVAFPLSVEDTVATYEIPYGSIQRSTESLTSRQKAQFEVPALKWADVSHDDYGVSLLTKSKYGFDIKGNIMRLSLLRSPLWPDPTADRGKHTIPYALFPHQHSWKEAGTVGKAMEFNNPLIAVRTGIHAGPLPVTESFAAISPSNIILTSIKKEEEGIAWVIQWYESVGEESVATVTLPSTVEKAVMSDFMEEDGEPIAFKGRTITVPTRANSVVTVKVWF